MKIEIQEVNRQDVYVLFFFQLLLMSGVGALAFLAGRNPKSSVSLQPKIVVEPAKLPEPSTPSVYVLDAASPSTTQPVPVNGNIQIRLVDDLRGVARRPARIEPQVASPVPAVQLPVLVPENAQEEHNSPPSVEETKSPEKEETAGYVQEEIEEEQEGVLLPPPKNP